MPLSLPVSSSHHTVSVSLPLFSTWHTQKHLHKRKSDCVNFRPPSSLPLRPPPFLSRRFRCSFFPGSFMQNPVLPCRPLPPSHLVTAQTQLTGGGRAAMTRSRAGQQIPLNPPASRPECVSLTLSFGVCVSIIIVLGLHLYICICVRHAEHCLCSDFSS